MEHITLVGAEQVQRAGSEMREAAEQTLRAAQIIAEENARQRQFLDDWLDRLAGTFADHVTMLRQS